MNHGPAGEPSIKTGAEERRRESSLSLDTSQIQQHLSVVTLGGNSVQRRAQSKYTVTQRG